VSAHKTTAGVTRDWKGKEGKEEQERRQDWGGEAGRERESASASLLVGCSYALVLLCYQYVINSAQR